MNTLELVGVAVVITVLPYLEPRLAQLFGALALGYVLARIFGAI